MKHFYIANMFWNINDTTYRRRDKMEQAKPNLGILHFQFVAYREINSDYALWSISTFI